MTRQKEIAEKTGFSLSVVSRALSTVKGKSNNISEDTTQIIRKVAEEIGYKPNIHASCLRKGKLPVIGVFLPAWGGTLIFELVMGISDAASHCNIPLSFYFDMTENSYGNFLDSMKDQGNSGVLSYVPRLSDNPDEKIMKMLRKYNNSDSHIVLLNTFCYQKHGFPHVSIDEEEGGRLAAQYLKSKKCSRFITIHYDTKLYTTRIKGFISGLDEIFTPELYSTPGPIVSANPFFMRTAADIIRTIKSYKGSGIFVPDDMIFRCLLYCAKENHIIPGKDFHVVSYDKPLRVSEPHEPPRIIQPFYEVGFKGFMKLYNLINGKKEENEILSPILKKEEQSFQ